MAWPPVPLDEDRGLACYVLDEIAEEFNIAVERQDAFARPDGLREVAKAIYEALARRGISYAHEPYDNGPGEVQFIRPPDTILSGSCEGTCLDLALLFAGLALGKEMVPILVMLEGHALVAVSLQDQRRAACNPPRRTSDGDWPEDGVLRDGTLLRKLVDDGRYVAIECTGFATTETPEAPEGANRVDGQLSFEAAVQAGRAQLDCRRFRFAIDIAVLRDSCGYRPHARDFPEWIQRYLAHSIYALMRAGSAQFGVSLADLIKEETRSSPSRALGWNTLIVGPPYVGKTCWAVRRAWRTRCDHMPSSILWFDAIKHGESTDVLTVLNMNLPVNEDYVIVIDDIHVARANLTVWTEPVAAFVAKRPGRVRVLWIARDESIAEFLTVGSERVNIEPFPLEQIVGLFVERLSSLPLDLRVVAALEAGLDPALGRKMKSWTFDTGLSYEGLATRIRKENDDRVGQTLSLTSKRLTSDYDAYLGLLPFGSIACPADERFVATMTQVGTAGITNLLETGVCIRSQDDTELQLTEHPFQLRRTLRYVDERGTEPRAVTLFAGPGVRKQTDSLSCAVLGRYVQCSDKPADALTRLYEHAEWAGVLDPMASAARYLMEATGDDALREVARGIAMKLSRTVYPSDERSFVQALEQDLCWWQAQHKAAADRPDDEVYEARRLDVILYEEAYIHYLLGRYAVAASIFRASVDAGFRAIDRALDPSRRTPDRLRRAQFALANIWIAGLLERSAALRGRLFDVAQGVPSLGPAPTTAFAEGIAATYRALAMAWEVGVEGLATGLPYLRAAREALRPAHQFPDAGLTIDLSEQRFVDFLRRHQLNGWLHALETSSWAWLFGSSSVRGPVPDVPPPNLCTLKRLAPLSDRDSRIAFRYRQVDLLFRAAGGERLATSDALHVAAMLRAAGSYEYLGDHMLLAWKTVATEQERQAIAWFLLERVPDVGCNALPKLALRRDLGAPFSTAS